MAELCWDCREVKAYAESHQCLDCFDGSYLTDEQWIANGYQLPIRPASKLGLNYDNRL